MYLKAENQLPGAEVLGARITAMSWQDTLDVLKTWATNGESRYVCISNVHMLVTAQKDPALNDAMRMADMATPDGAPVAWMLRRLGFGLQQRISGAELMHAYLDDAADRGEPVFLLGSTPETLSSLVEVLRQTKPALVVADHYSPPFRTLSEPEDAILVRRINDSGARTVWVSLGCPKQEKWMLDHKNRINAVMFGVGAAFDFIAGTKKRAPLWMQQCGLEWLHRLTSEPGRLWRRYLTTNTMFMLQAVRQLMSRSRAVAHRDKSV